MKCCERAKVTEILQGLIDLGGGSYFTIAQPTPITPLLGDPAPGYPKELRLEYELRGRNGIEIRNEAQGYLTKPLYLEAKPVISPIIFIVSGHIPHTILTTSPQQSSSPTRTLYH